MPQKMNHPQNYVQIIFNTCGDLPASHLPTTANTTSHTPPLPHSQLKNKTITTVKHQIKHIRKYLNAVPTISKYIHTSSYPHNMKISIPIDQTLYMPFIICQVGFLLSLCHRVCICVSYKNPLYYSGSAVLHR